MNKEILTIEDCLETLAGLRQAPKFEIVKEDHTIVTSIARQCFKGTALTDRQFALMQEKLQTYKQQFEQHEYVNFDLAVDTLRQPLRHIDRSKYIRIVNHGEMLGPDRVYESYKSEWKWIKVRFPFSKKLIIDLQSIKHGPNEYHHEKGTHEHYFYFNETNVYNVIEIFKNKNFVIDSELLEYYEKVKLLEDEKTHAPAIIDFEFKNVHPRAQELALQELGNPSIENIVCYKDRANIYGIKYFDNTLQRALEQENVLTKSIVGRRTKEVFVKSTKWTLDEVVNSLRDLQRIPLVVLLDDTKDPCADLMRSYNVFKYLFSSDEISVQFRLSSDKDNGFNDYIKNNKLNSPVDNNTKIVYTSMDKLNKPLFVSDCNPRTALLMSSHRLGLKPQKWLSSNFDLVIHYDETISQFVRYQRTMITEV